MRTIKIQIGLILLALISISYSCSKDFLKVDPPKDKVSPTQIFENDEIATSAITGIYSNMATGGFASGALNSLTILAGLSADELKGYNLTLEGYYINDIRPNDFWVSSLWSQPYYFIFTANSILERIGSASKLTPTTKKQIEGEAKFVRAFCYFYLTNLFGDVPLITGTDYRVNEKVGASPQAEIYIKIVNDLTEAENLLSDNYVSIERVRPNKWAAKALLARVYLYTKNWDLAKQKATEVIEHRTLFSLVDELDNVFQKNSSESIWQLMPSAGNNTNEGRFFTLVSTPLNISLSPELRASFDNLDNRKSKWTKEFNNSTGTYSYPSKYKKNAPSTPVAEYSMVIRLAELYLIRAEARANLLEIDLALADINLIRKRAGLTSPILGLNQNQCLLEVENQRKFELFSEWGHRWLDLKRTGRASIILAPKKGLSWQNTDLLYPIPQNEINVNPLLNQNPDIEPPKNKCTKSY